MSSTTTPFDQAAGLRELFAALPQSIDEPAFAPEVRTPTIHALVCPQRPALALVLAQICSQSWRRQGVSHLWVDELDFERREGWPLACKLRYDMAQGLAQFVPLSQTLHQQTEGQCYYASARRLAQYANQINISLVAQLRKSALDFDHVLVSLDPENPSRPWSVYGAPMQPLLLCEATESGVQQSLNWLNNLHAKNALDLNQVSVVFYSAEGQSETTQLAQTLWLSSWQALYGCAPAWVGHAAIKPGSGLSAHLPCLQDLAAQWLPQLAHA